MSTALTNVCPVCDTPDNDHLDWCTPQARAKAALTSKTVNDLIIETDSCIDEIEWFATRKINLAKESERSGKAWADTLMSDIADLRSRLKIERAFHSSAVETECDLRNWYCHDGIKVHLLTGMDRETALKSLREEKPDAWESDLKPAGGRAHIIFNSSSEKCNCGGGHMLADHSSHLPGCPARPSVKSEAPRCSECDDSGTVFDTEGREYDCYACPISSASTGGAPPQPSTSPVECPKCRTQLAFEGDTCWNCQENDNARINS